MFKEAALLLFKWVLFYVACLGSPDIYLAFRARLIRVFVSLGLYERRHVKFLCAILRPGDFAIDVGANLGAYALAMSEAVGPSGAVFAFEPLRKVHDQLAKSVANRLNVRCFMLGLSDVSRAEEEIQIPLLFGKILEPALASVNGPSIEHLGVVGRWLLLDKSGKLPFKIEKIKVCTLDSMLDQIGRASVIKVDIEGHELNFLRGAKLYLRKYRSIVQFEELDMSEKFDSYEAIATALDYFVCQLIEGEMVQVKSIEEAWRSRNFYLIPVERAAEGLTER